MYKGNFKTLLTYIQLFKCLWGKASLYTFIKMFLFLRTMSILKAFKSRYTVGSRF